MSSLKDRLLASKPRELTVSIDGDDFLVRGVSRTEKNQMVERCTSKAGKLDGAKFEAAFLAACVLDPSTGEQVMPDPADWNVPSHVSSTLLEAAMDVCGFSPSERAAAKN